MYDGEETLISVTLNELYRTFNREAIVEIGQLALNCIPSEICKVGEEETILFSYKTYDKNGLLYLGYDSDIEGTFGFSLDDDGDSTKEVLESQSDLPYPLIRKPLKNLTKILKEDTGGQGGGKEKTGEGAHEEEEETVVLGCKNMEGRTVRERGGEGVKDKEDPVVSRAEQTTIYGVQEDVRDGNSQLVRSTERHWQRDTLSGVVGLHEGFHVTSKVDKISGLSAKPKKIIQSHLKKILGSTPDLHPVFWGGMAKRQGLYATFS
ncbi:hypothetical protein PROFUN_16811 [Planoprotostelium fungivorum]|uniref:Uncharacterized protein n=1 Tax=Planoprotostelium fungivorum TaxID=1890364 RepID=A0A2P6MNQ1_9EUKA|nr:hypothetical protein PROFUN_16811 [Planoprotostelium fungivorum]